MRPSSSYFRTVLAFGLTFALVACSGDRAIGQGASQNSAPETSESSFLNEASVNSSAQKLFGGEPPILVRESPIQGLIEVYVQRRVLLVPGRKILHAGGHDRGRHHAEHDPGGPR